MTNKRNVITLAVAIVALGVAAPLLMPVVAKGKSSRAITPHENEDRIEKAITNARVRGDKMKPAVDLAVAHNYAGALEEFRRLHKEGERTTAYQALCLLHLGQPSDGLALLKSGQDRKLPVELRSLIQTALAVAAKDEPSLMEALAIREHFALMESAPDSQKSEVLRASVAPKSIPVAKRLMEVALVFGRRYDRATLHLVGEEAMKRGATDSESLIQYASLIASNGDLREAQSLYETAARNATDDSLKLRALRRVTQIKNIIIQFTKDRSIEEEEARRHKKNDDEIYRSFWN